MKKFISAVMAFAMTVGMMAGMSVAHAEVTGTGTETDPYLISSYDDFTNETRKGYSKLVNDITELGTTLKPSGTWYLDFNGHTISGSAGSLFDNNGNSLTLYDSSEEKTGKIVSTNTTAAVYALKVTGSNAPSIIIKDISIDTLNNNKSQSIYLVNDVNLVLDEVKLNSMGYALNMASGICEMNNVTVNSEVDATGYIFQIKGGALTINGGEYTYRGTLNGCQLTCESGKTATTIIENATFASSTGSLMNIAKQYNGTIDINGCDFTASADKKYIIVDGSETYEIPINISGGTFNGNISRNAAKAKSKFTITGGTFSFDPTNYVDTEAYDVTEADGIYTVAAKNVEPEPTEDPTENPTEDPTEEPTTEPTPEPTPEISAVEPIDNTVIEGSDGFGKLFKFVFKCIDAITADKISVSYDGTTAPSLSGTTIAANSEVVFGILVSSEDKAKIDGIDATKFSVTVVD